MTSGTNAVRLVLAVASFTSFSAMQGCFGRDSNYANRSGGPNDMQERVDVLKAMMDALDKYPATKQMDIDARVLEDVYKHMKSPDDMVKFGQKVMKKANEEKENKAKVQTHPAARRLESKATIESDSPKPEVQAVPKAGAPPAEGPPAEGKSVTAEGKSVTTTTEDSSWLPSSLPSLPSLQDMTDFVGLTAEPEKKEESPKSGEGSTAALQTLPGKLWDLGWSWTKWAISLKTWAVRFLFAVIKKCWAKMTAVLSVNLLVETAWDQVKGELEQFVPFAEFLKCDEADGADCDYATKFSEAAAAFQQGGFSGMATQYAGDMVQNMIW